MEKFDSVTAWLMAGDPVIRWQTMRDIVGLPRDEWQSERLRTLESGWGWMFLERLQPDGTWPDGRWTGSVWTFQIVIDCGLPAEHPRLRAAAHYFIQTHLVPERLNTKWLLTQMDLCHLGFWLRLGAYFIGPDARLALVAQTILNAQMLDGGWNCRLRTKPNTTHGSFHTTFNVLEALAEAACIGIISHDEFRASEARALEFMLAHRMYRSDKTGAIADARFTHLTYPSHWHYNVLRGLEYVRSTPEIGDPRLADPIELILSRCGANGRWPVEKRIPGDTLFDMEKFGGESRWNTLRALRVLRARDLAMHQANA